MLDDGKQILMTIPRRSDGNQNQNCAEEPPPSSGYGEKASQESRLFWPSVRDETLRKGNTIRYDTIRYPIYVAVRCGSSNVYVCFPLCSRLY